MATRANPASKPVPMCCVEINYQHYLLPMETGLKLVKLLQESVECDVDWEGAERHQHYVVKDTPRVELVLVKPDQIRMPAGSDTEPVGRQRGSTVVEQLDGALKQLRLTRR